MTDTHNSDGSLTGAPITNDPATWPGNAPLVAHGVDTRDNALAEGFDPVWKICCAVATAEGYGNGEGVAPYDMNNPGDLSPGDEGGQPTASDPETHTGSVIIHFATAEGGWRALHRKFKRIVEGRSTVFPAALTWMEIGKKYAGDSVVWVGNVTRYLQVDPESTPADYVRLRERRSL